MDHSDRITGADKFGDDRPCARSCEVSKIVTREAEVRFFKVLLESCGGTQLLPPLHGTSAIGGNDNGEDERGGGR
jgi:hypothetical protein